MLCQPATVSEAQGYIWDALGMAFKIKTARLVFDSELLLDI